MAIFCIQEMGNIWGGLKVNLPGVPMDNLEEYFGKRRGILTLYLRNSLSLLFLGCLVRILRKFQFCLTHQKIYPQYHYQLALKMAFS